MQVPLREKKCCVSNFVRLIVVSVLGKLICGTDFAKRFLG